VPTLRSRKAVVLAIAGVVLAGCGSHGQKLVAPTATNPVDVNPATTSRSGQPAPPVQTTASYHPNIDPAKFTNDVTNTYFALVPGKTLVYRGVRDGQPTRHTFTVTHDTKVVMGVRCAVIKDVVTQAGSLVEKTTDWYAQDDVGNVWYFGEDTAEYQNGVVTSTAGTWEAGVDKAQPGIVMPADPVVGKWYRQEYRPGVALDTARVLTLRGNVTVPAGTYHDVIVTFDKNPLDPSKKERKWYAPGVGFVQALLHGGGHYETTKLVG
jgi:hypothetical protein